MKVNYLNFASLATMWKIALSLDPSPAPAHWKPFLKREFSLRVNFSNGEFSWVLNRLDSPLINDSVFCHPTQPYSALYLYQFWRILPASPFILEFPFINSCAYLTAVAWSHCFFYIAQNCFLITMKHDVAWSGESSKRTRDSSCR